MSGPSSFFQGRFGASAASSASSAPYAGKGQKRPASSDASGPRKKADLAVEVKSLGEHVLPKGFEAVWDQQRGCDFEAPSKRWVEFPKDLTSLVVNGWQFGNHSHDFAIGFDRATQTASFSFFLRREDDTHIEFRIYGKDMEPIKVQGKRTIDPERALPEGAKMYARNNRLIIMDLKMKMGGQAMCLGATDEEIRLMRDNLASVATLSTEKQHIIDLGRTLLTAQDIVIARAFETDADMAQGEQHTEFFRLVMTLQSTYGLHWYLGIHPAFSEIAGTHLAAFTGKGLPPFNESVKLMPWLSKKSMLGTCVALPPRTLRADKRDWAITEELSTLRSLDYNTEKLKGMFALPEGSHHWARAIAYGTSGRSFRLFVNLVSNRDGVRKVLPEEGLGVKVDVLTTFGAGLSAQEQWVTLRGNITTSIKVDQFDMEIIVTCRRPELFKEGEKVPIRLQAIVDSKSFNNQLQGIRLVEQDYQRPANSLNIPVVILGGHNPDIEEVAMVVDAKVTATWTQWFENRLATTLNSSQRAAVRQMIKAPGGFVNVRGPPGCGKTRTGMVGLEYAAKCEVKSLACAPSNNAAQGILERIIADGQLNDRNVMRWTPAYVTHAQFKSAMESRNPDAMDEADRYVEMAVDEFDTSRADWSSFAESSPAAHMKRSVELNMQLDTEFGRVCQEFRKLHAELQKPVAPHDPAEKRGRDQKDYTKLYEKILAFTVARMHVVVSTLNSCGADLLRANFAAEVLFVDEAAQALEADVAVALGNYRESLRLMVQLGDESQLPPVVVSKKYNEMSKQMELSMFERLSRTSGQNWIDINYRMPPDVCDFPSRQFYDGKVRTDVSKDEETPVQRTVKAVWGKVMSVTPPITSNRVALSTPDDAFSEDYAGTTTACNRKEGSFIAWYIESLLGYTEVQEGEVQITADKITVICPYIGQVWYLAKILPAGVKIVTINKFQGQENDIIIFSLTKNDKANADTVAWISDARRMCVALTRAKSALCLVGAFNKYEKHVKRWSNSNLYPELVALLQDLRLTRDVRYIPSAMHKTILAQRPPRELLTPEELALIGLNVIDAEEEDNDVDMDDGNGGAKPVFSFGAPPPPTGQQTPAPGQQTPAPGQQTPAVANTVDVGPHATITGTKQKPRNQRRGAAKGQAAPWRGDSGRGGHGGRGGRRGRGGSGGVGGGVGDIK